MVYLKFHHARIYEYESRLEAIPDPTTLIVVDEADRLAMNSVDQLRSIFDQSGLSMVLIGMPRIEKRIARYPQFFSRMPLQSCGGPYILAILHCV